MNQVQYILCDVEGTTTDIRFVHNELFPLRVQNSVLFCRKTTEQKQSAQALDCDLKRW